MKNLIRYILISTFSLFLCLGVGLLLYAIITNNNIYGISSIIIFALCLLYIIILAIIKCFVNSGYCKCCDYSRESYEEI